MEKILYIVRGIPGSGKYITLYTCSIYDYPASLLQEDGFLLPDPLGNNKHPQMFHSSGFAIAAGPTGTANVTITASAESGFNPFLLSGM